MDKGGDHVRRGSSRFSTAKPTSVSYSELPVTGFGGVRGDLQVSVKSKKEKVRSLSAVARELSTHQMGPHRPNASPSSAKRFKPLKKRQFLNGCNGVDPASVPRKIRSAMKKKRSRESILSDSEKVSHKKNGIESPEKDGNGIKKSKKQGDQEWSTKQAVSGPITKDEEEVVETLYAMAGMFPDNGSSARSELDCESLPDKSLVLQDDPDESANATIEASGTTQDASPCPERSPEGDANISSLNESGREQTNFPASAKFLVASNSSALRTNPQAMPTMSRSENGTEVALHDSDLCLAMGLNMPRQRQISHIGRKPDVGFQKAGGIDCNQEHIIKEQNATEGPALWPGLSPRAPAGVNASYLQSFAAKAPYWLNAARCASKQHVMESCSSDGKIPDVGMRKKSWKRCSAHVHISHLIRSIEVSKRQAKKEPEIHESHQMRVHQGSNGVYMEEVHGLNGLSDRISSAAGTVYSATGRNSRETENAILQRQWQCHYQDMPQGPQTHVLDGPQQQSFNFLSLSAGSSRLKVNDSSDNIGSRYEPLSKLQVPCFQSMQQQHGLMPIPTPQSQYASTSYLNRLPVAGPQVRLQQPHYYGSPICGSHYSSTVPNKQQLQHLWAAQLGSQGRSAVNSNIVRAQYPNWQSGRHDSSGAHVILPHSPASLEALGSKITAISEQQLFALASSRTKGLDIHLNSACEEGRFRSSGTLSLQLLCDERI